MEIIDLFSAEKNLLELIKRIEVKEEDTYVIARDGKPVAMLVSCQCKGNESRVGTARGKFTVPDDFELGDAEIISMFEGTIKSEN